MLQMPQKVLEFLEELGYEKGAGNKLSIVAGKPSELLKKIQRALTSISMPTSA